MDNSGTGLRGNPIDIAVWGLLRGNRLRAAALLAACAWLLAGCQPGTAGNGKEEAVAPHAAPELREYMRQVEQWRARRIENLRAADGWLSYMGSGRLRPGRFSVGSGPGNDIQLPGGPSRLGTLHLDRDGRAVLEGVSGSGATVNGRPLDRTELVAGIVAEREATRVRLGAAEFYLVRTGKLTNWRYRDPDAPMRSRFRGVEHFPVDLRWRVVADWQPFATPREVTLLTSIGTPLQAMVPGEAVFTVEGRTFRLQPVVYEKDPEWFIPFVDRTSGKESYGGARYLFTAPARDGKLVLDFNRAENPPCALTPHVVCPIAPPSNRLDLAVTAGEKNYLPQ